MAINWSEKTQEQKIEWLFEQLISLRDALHEMERLDVEAYRKTHFDASGDMRREQDARTEFYAQNTARKMARAILGRMDEE